MTSTLETDAAYAALTARYERERREVGEAQLASWDARPLRRVVCLLVCTGWLSVGGQPILPLGLFAALLLLVPEVQGWSAWRRLRFTGHRALWLVGAALLGLFFGGARIGLLEPSGALISLGLRLYLPCF